MFIAQTLRTEYFVGIFVADKGLTEELGGILVVDMLLAAHSRANGIYLYLIMVCESCELSLIGVCVLDYPLTIIFIIVDRSYNVLGIAFQALTL